MPPIRNFFAIAFVALTVGCATSSGHAMNIAKPPPAPERPVVDTYFGTLVTDPYRWMESKSPEFIQWLRQQDDVARHALARISGRAALLATVTAYSRGAPSVDSLVVAGPHVFFEEKPAASDKNRLRVRDRSAAEGPAATAVDIEKSGYSSIDHFAPSPDGRYLAYGASSNGSEDSVVRVIETSTGKEESPPIERGRFARVSWLPNGQAFAYAQELRREPGAEKSPGMVVRLRQLKGSGEDAAIFGYGVASSPGVSILEDPRVVLHGDGNYAVGITDHDVDDPMSFFVKRRDELLDPKVPWRQIVTAADEVLNYATQGNDLYVVSFKGAPQGRILRYTLSDPTEPSVVVPAGRGVIRDVALARDGLYFVTLDAGVSRLFALPTSGALVEIALPPQASISALTADVNADGGIVKLETWTTSPAWMDCSLSGASCRDLGLVPPHPVSFSDIVTERVVVRAHDGTAIPMTILHRADMKRNGQNPATLYAYGSYGIPVLPSFQAVRRAWFDAGGIIAYAHVRGGGEFGKAWRDSGSKANKVNSITDYIECAEALIKTGMTSSAHLAAHGGSAGGIVVNNAIVRRPDLFRAAVVEVGYADAMRFEDGPDGPQNVQEFGSVKTEGGYRALAAMDPYERVVTGTEYPAVMFTGGLNDPRVPIWQPAKMAARLQAATRSDRPLLLRVEFEGGHGLGATRSQAVEVRADMYSFLLWQLGDRSFTPRSE